MPRARPPPSLPPPIRLRERPGPGPAHPSNHGQTLIVQVGHPVRHRGGHVGGGVLRAWRAQGRAGGAAGFRGRREGRGASPLTGHPVRTERQAHCLPTPPTLGHASGDNARNGRGWAAGARGAHRRRGLPEETNWLGIGGGGAARRPPPFFFFALLQQKLTRRTVPSWSTSLYTFSEPGKQSSNVGFCRKLRLEDCGVRRGSRARGGRGGWGRGGRVRPRGQEAAWRSHRFFSVRPHAPRPATPLHPHARPGAG